MQRSNEVSVFTSGDSPLTMTIGGTIVSYTASGGAPYISLNGGDFLYIADGSWSAPLNPLTMLIGFRPNSLQNAFLCGIWPTTTQKSFLLEIDSSGNLHARATSDGSTIKTATLASAYTANAWHLAALRLTGNTQLLAYCNANVAELTTAVPTIAQNSTAEFAIGAADTVPTSSFNGDVAICVVVSSIVHQDHLDRMYYHMLRFTGA